VTKVWASPRGEVTLSRWPVRQDDTLQAWDGADRYLLDELADRVSGAARVLVVDDAFGALAVALASAGVDVVSWGDSEVSRLATQVNAERAGVEVPWAAVTDDVTGPFDAALVRIPKSLRRLKWTLERLAGVLGDGVPVLMGAKIKSVQKSHVGAAEAALGPANSTLGRYKARLVVATTEKRERRPMSLREWEVEPGLHQRALPGVFGEERLDGGTALLLAQIADWGAGRIVDLGCGAGALGIVAGARNPEAEVVFRDSSHRAVESARRGWASSFGERPARFEIGDALAGMEDACVDVVLCNPPFHQGTEITRRVAAHMFAESSRVLRPGGRLLVVGNLHLGYRTGMGRTLMNVTELSSDRRFAVYEGFRLGR